MARINVLGNYLNGADEVTTLKNYYSAWRETNARSKVRFFQLYEGFKDKGYLANLDGGALRLYLYFSFAANNTYGDSWHSIEKIAEYFGKQTRTIDTWIQELVQAGLIYRTRDQKKSSSTFVIPYSDTLIPFKPETTGVQDTLDVLDQALEFIGELHPVYGPLKAVYHIFHWGTTRKGGHPSPNADSTNFLLIITQRSDDVLTGHVLELNNSKEYGISQLAIDEVATFDSPFRLGEEPVRGIAVSHTYRLKILENRATLLQLLRDLAEATPIALNRHPKVEYGLIDDVLQTDDPQESGSTEDDE